MQLQKILARPVLNLGYSCVTKVAILSLYYAVRMKLSMQKHILVMEDNEVLRQLYTRALRTTGQAVFQAATLQEARTLLNEYAFDVFVCDMEVGGERGLDLLQEQRDNLYYSGTHIIVATAEDRYRQRCLELGVDLFLEKPIEISPLVTLVGRLMSSN